MKKWLYTIILLMFSLTSIHAQYETSEPFNHSDFSSNSSSDDRPFEHNAELSKQHNPFDSNSSGARTLSDFGDRPGNGEGIGQVSVKDDLIFIPILVIAYGLFIWFRKRKD